MSANVFTNVPRGPTTTPSYLGDGMSSVRTILASTSLVSVWSLLWLWSSGVPWGFCISDQGLVKELCKSFSLFELIKSI